MGRNLHIDAHKDAARRVPTRSPTLMTDLCSFLSAIYFALLMIAMNSEFSMLFPGKFSLCEKIEGLEVECLCKSACRLPFPTSFHPKAHMSLEKLSNLNLTPNGS